MTEEQLNLLLDYINSKIAVEVGEAVNQRACKENYDVVYTYPELLQKTIFGD